MTPLQKLELEKSELREKLGGILEKAEKTDEDRAEMDRITKRLQEAEIETRAALLAEPEVKPVNDPATPEGREVAGLLRRASVGDYLAEAVMGQPVDGAPRELREAVMGSDLVGWLPLEVLEQRVDAVTGVTTATLESQAPIASRVFGRSSMDYMGVAQPSVPVGDYTLPRINAGTTADVRSPGVDLDGTAATLDMDTLGVVRLTSSYTYTRESAEKVRGFGDALAADLRGVMAEKRDALMLNGQAAIANTSPAVTGLINSLADPTNPAAAPTASEVLAIFDGAVDGKYAQASEEVRMLVNAASYQYAIALLDSTGNLILRDRLPSNRFRVSANMPATANTIATLLTFAAGAGVRGAVSPIWGGGVQLIPDPITEAKAGKVLLTAILLTSFAVADTGPYGRHEWYIS